jgi:hypothetical protein
MTLQLLHHEFPYIFHFFISAITAMSLSQYMYTVRPARMRSSVPLLEPGPPRFFWWYKNSE